MKWFFIPLIAAFAMVANAQTDRMLEVDARVAKDPRLTSEIPDLLPANEACALLAWIINANRPGERAMAVEALQRVPGWAQWFDNKLNEYCQPSKGDGPTKTILVEDLVGEKQEVVVRDRTEKEARAAGDGRAKAERLFKALRFVPRVEAAVLALRQLDTHGPTFWSGHQHNLPLSSHALWTVRAVGNLGVRLEGAPYEAGNKWEDWMNWWQANKARYEPLVTGVAATTEPPTPPPAAPAPPTPAPSTPPPSPVSLTKTTPPAVVESNIPWAAILGGCFFLCALGVLWWRSKSRPAP